MKNNSKRIGNIYERYCSKLLSKWFTGNDTDLVVWRNLGSGSVNSVRCKKGINTAVLDGDFQPLDLKYQKFFDIFFLDSKSLTKLNFFMINLKNIKSNKLLNEWIKVCKDAGKKIPIMIVKCRDDRSVPDFVVVPITLLLKIDNSIIFHFSELGNIDFQIITQDDFFKNNTYENFLDVGCRLY